MNPFQRKIITFVTFVGGLYFFLEYILPEKIGEFKFAAFHEDILKALQIISIATIGLGIINIVTVYGSSIIRARKGWRNALALMIGFLMMMTFEFVNMVTAERALAARKQIQLLAKFSEKVAAEPVETRQDKLKLLDNELTALANRDRKTNPILKKIPPVSSAVVEEQEFFAGIEKSQAALHTAMAGEPSPESLIPVSAELKLTAQLVAKLAQKAGDSTFSQRAGNFVSEAFWIPLTAAIFSLLAFFMATAAYRAFRVRSLEAAIIMAAALLVTLGQIPHGPLYVSESLPEIRLWLLKNVNTPAFRAIYFGSTVAGLALAVRIWFSLERSPIDRE